MASAGSIIARDDTLLGVCFALGQDFGFNPLYLRVPLGAVVLWSLPAAVVAYLALGLVVAFSRWLAPDPQVGRAEESAEAPDEEFRLAA